MKSVGMHQSSPALGLSPRQFDTLDADVLREHAEHEARVLAEARAETRKNIRGLDALISDLRGDSARTMAAIYRVEHDGPACSVFDSPVLHGVVTTDDTVEVAALVNQMAELPHIFAARFMELERRLRLLEVSHARTVDMVQAHEALPIQMREVAARVDGLAYREVL